MPAVFLGGKALTESETFAAQLPVYPAGAAVIAITGDLTSAGAAIAGEALAAAATHVSLHTGPPGDDGANEIADSQTAFSAVYDSGAKTVDIESAVTGAEEITGTATHYGVWAVS